MKKTVILLLIYFSTALVLIAQNSLTKKWNKLCSIDSGSEEVTTEILIKESNPIENKDDSNQFLRSIKDVLKVSSDNCKIRNITSRKIASAGFYYQNENDDVIIPVIYYNKVYYESMFNTANEKKLATTWILAHEFSHHHDQHTFENGKTNLYIKYKQEIIADKLAGYVLAKLYPNEDFSVIEKIIRTIMIKDVHTPSHPSKDYRVLSVKSGFLEGLLENRPLNIEVDLNGKKFRLSKNSDKIVFEQKGEFTFFKETINLFSFGEENDEDAYGVQYNGRTVKVGVDGDNELDYIMLYNCTKGKANGNGYIIWSDGNNYWGNLNNGFRTGYGEYNWNSGTIYKGVFLNNKEEGYGEYYFTDGSIYKGFWRNGKQHGKGVYYKNNQIIFDGCWKEGVFQNNNNCENE